jgi:hypothetical protein
MIIYDIVTWECMQGGSYWFCDICYLYYDLYTYYNGGILCASNHVYYIKSL